MTLAAGLVLVASCSGGGADSAASSTVPASSSTEPPAATAEQTAAPGTANTPDTTTQPTATTPATTAPPTSVLYDESTQTPVDQFEAKIVEVLGRDSDNVELIDCVTSEIMSGYDRGDIGADDIDAYVRRSTVTDSMNALLSDVQRAETCAQ